MKSKKLHRLSSYLRGTLTIEKILLFYGSFAGLVFTYALSLLVQGEEFGAYSLLLAKISAIVEHGLMIALLGIVGALLFDLLKKEGGKE